MALDNTLDNLLERAYDAEQAGDLIRAIELRALYHSGQQQQIDQAAPAAPLVHIREDGDEDEVWFTFVAGSGLTCVEVSPNDTRPGVTLFVGGHGINTQLKQIITLADVRQLYNNLGAILSDPRLPGYTPPTLPAVRVASVQDDHGETFSSLVVGEGFTEARIAQDDDQPGVLLVVGGSCINQELGEIITLDDVRQLRDNLTALLSDPRLAAGPLAPLGSAPSVRPVPSICDDTADPRHGTQIGVDWVSGPGVPEDVPYIHIPDAPSEHPLCFYPLNENGIPLPELESWLPHIIALLSDPRVQAARARYEAASAHLMKKAA